jgi:hypothetical protein
MFEHTKNSFGKIVGPDKGRFLRFTLRLHFLFVPAFFGALDFTAVFGRGALGFLVGTFVAFFALDGDFFGFGADACFFFSAVFFPVTFFGDLTFALAGTCFFSLPRAGAVAVPAAFSGLAAEDSLKEPEAPLPLVCTSSPDATAPFKYFLINGANFSASTS